MQWEEIVPWYAEFLQAIPKNAHIESRNIGTPEHPMWSVRIRLDDVPRLWIAMIGHGKHAEPLEAFIQAGRHALNWKARQMPEAVAAAREQRIVRFLEVLHTNKNLLPRWVRVVRRARPETDPSKTEVAIETDAGVIHLQIEGSRSKKRIMRKQAHADSLPIVLVREAAKDREVLHTIINELTQLYNHLHQGGSIEASATESGRFTMEVTFPDNDCPSEAGIADDSPSCLRAMRVLSLLFPHGAGIRWWITSVRLARMDERRQRKDLFVETDLGVIPLKTVTSHSARVMEYARQRQQLVPCIIVRDDIGDEILVRAVLKHLYQVRDQWTASMHATNTSETNSP